MQYSCLVDMINDGEGNKRFIRTIVNATEVLMVKVDSYRLVMKNTSR